MHTPEQPCTGTIVPIYETEELVIVSHEPTPNEIRIEAKLRALAALAAAGAATGVDVKDLHKAASRAKRPHHASVPAFGVCVGRDNGKDPRVEQPRNQPCKCGSGKKAKKCCKTISTPAIQVKEATRG